MFPYGWKSGDPIFYCERDCTFHPSQKEWSFHMHQLDITKYSELANDNRNIAQEHLASMSRYKRSTFPQIQKRIDNTNGRLKLLLKTGDWRETNKSRSEKRREIAELRHMRYKCLDELKERQKEFSVLKRKWRDAADAALFFKEKTEESKKRFESAKEWWKTKEENEKEGLNEPKTEGEEK